ncbi:serine hydrolase domain-containing protein [Sphingomonas kyeonggiensis]|uniref:CubicO group peptidase (Beta-lactamase class C family) n=1 Tax=Sphingomonas kyeonggiensis TaxID=1268553 RepID=A0A7W6JV71_9SPHN|nr:serine hydrolase domain-containing protein [Sphingomonas kyeonggiensis]MBB4100170.1 CubicO group peptidase (beta-lactamase class C family) [Sphingomonas kyeonggiensis]
MRSSLSVLCAVLLVAAAPAFAQPSATAIARDADAALAAAIDPKGSGAVVLIARGDTILYRKARGMAEVELGVPLSPDQAFRIASISKSFTAALLVQMAARGEVALDAPAIRHLPDVSLDPRITLRQLLSHTAGVAENDSAPQPPFGNGEVPLAEQVRRIAARPLSFEPGTVQRYSNAGYILLAAVIEKVTGQGWDAAMRTRLFAPLELADTAYDRADMVVPGRVAGYAMDKGVLRNAAPFNVSIPKTAGSLRSTATDLLRWMRALSQGKVVGTEGFAEMSRPALAGVGIQDRYGLGLYRWQVRGQDAIGHTGQINGFASALFYLPAEDATVVVLANNDGFDAQALARRMAAIVIGRPYPLLAASQVLPRDATALVGTYGSDPATMRMVAIAGDRITVARPGRQPLPAMLDGQGNIHFVPDELSYFAPVRDGAGKVIRLDYFARGEGPALALERKPQP